MMLCSRRWTVTTISSKIAVSSWAITAGLMASAVTATGNATTRRKTESNPLLMDPPYKALE
jgi:hypothetical protein